MLVADATTLARSAACVAGVLLLKPAVVAELLMFVVVHRIVTMVSAILPVILMVVRGHVSLIAPLLIHVFQANVMSVFQAAPKLARPPVLLIIVEGPANQIVRLPAHVTRHPANALLHAR